jgi:hypothetical protein
MKHSITILASTLVSQLPSLIKGQLRSVPNSTPCLPSTKFQLHVDGPCNYQSLLSSIEERLNHPDPQNDEIIPCPHSAAEEILQLLSVNNETSASALISDLCKVVLDEYNSEHTVSWSEVTQKGDKFDKEYYDGNGDWNEEHQSNHPHPPFLPGRPSNVLNREAERVDDLYENHLQRYPLEWPENMSNFENCQYQSAMCCWVSDRQANDNNGNCATPYDLNCLDADPGDNTDLCAVDMARSNKDSVHVDDGFVLFPENTEGPIHCHGLAWGEDETEADFRFRANNLFFVSMSDHLHDRGYVRAVQGAPMCACVEDMPIVSRSDCTEITATEFYTFTFHASNSGDVKISLDYVDIDFNACQARGNNNLQRFMERLLEEGRVSKQKYDKFRETVVGDHQCGIAVTDLLFEKGYKFRAPVYDGWAQMYGRGSMISPDTNAALWAAINSGSYVRRVCKSCHYDSHKDIIYKRLTPNGEIDFKDLFLSNWFSNPVGAGTNIRGSDFNLFSSMQEAQNNENHWTFCNYNDEGIGFPRDCGPTGFVPSEWNSMKGHGEMDFAYYLYTGND